MNDLVWHLLAAAAGGGAAWAGMRARVADLERRHGELGAELRPLVVELTARVQGLEVARAEHAVRIESLGSEVAYQKARGERSGAHPRAPRE